MKKIVAFLILIIVAFFLFFRPPPIDIEGQWSGKITHNNVEYFCDYPITFSNWTDSLYLNDNGKRTSAHLEIKYDEERPYVLLSSKKTFLNGRFHLTIDTIPNIYIDRKDFTIALKLKSDSTTIDLQRKVYPKPPKKIDFPVRGRP